MSLVTLIALVNNDDDAALMRREIMLIRSIYANVMFAFVVCNFEYS